MAEPDWLSGADHVWLPYTQMKTAPRPRAVKATHGSRIVLADGRELVDGIGSWWTAVHGYNHPALLDAVRAQMEAAPHVMLGGLVHEPVCRLAERLCNILPGGMEKVFFCESGSVAVEVAMKIAVQYWRNTTGKIRPRFLSFKGGYHGDTFATMAVCDPEDSMHAMFAGALTPQHIVDLPTDAASTGRMEQALAANPDIAAVIVEPLLQGATGMRMHDAATLKRIRDACDRHGVLLIFDEIFTGFGRLGEMFAADKAGVAPDIITLGKALTGGVCPLACTAASGKVYAAFHSDDATHALMHGPTYSGHALACAAANASLDLFEQEPRLEQARALAAALRTAFEPLRGAPGVADIRVMGSIGVVEMEKPFDLQRWRAWFIERGVFIRPLGKVIYLSPAYTIDAGDLARLTSAVGEAVHAMT
jgi:adenosylmethionine-8-amino-7-oxononanoate aminotransferase